jgi:hypothetical protein
MTIDFVPVILDTETVCGLSLHQSSARLWVGVHYNTEKKGGNDGYDSHIDRTNSELKLRLLMLEYCERR